MKIEQTFPGETNFSQFERLWESLYDKGYWPFKQSESIPTRYLHACFVAMEEEKPLGRIALYLNPELTYEGKKVATLGCFECVNETKIAKELIDSAMRMAKEQGAEFVMGPMNGSTWENYRFSVHNDYANFFLEPYYNAYYNDLFTTAGLHSIAEYHSLLDKEVVFKIKGAKEKEEKFLAQGVHFRSVNLDEFESVLGEIHELNNIAYSSNFLFTSIEKEDFIAKYMKAKQFIDSNFMILAYSKKGELIGYYFCTPDYYNTKEKSLIIKSIARHPAEEYRGLGYAIGNQIYDKAQELGYQSVIHAFMYDDGTSAPQSNHFSENDYKKYKLYGKTI